MFFNKFWSIFFRFGPGAIAMIVLAGCTSQSGSFFREDYSIPDIPLQAESAEVQIIDQRENVELVSFSVPTMTWPGQGQSASPPLDPRIDRLLYKRVHPLLAGTDGSLVFRVKVITAKNGWSAGLMSESVFAEVALEIDVIDKATSAVIVSGAAESSGKHSDPDAGSGDPTDFLEEVFVDAFVVFLSDPDRLKMINHSLE